MNVTRSRSMSSSATSGSQRAMKTRAERHDAGQRDAVEQSRDVRARRGHEHAVVGAELVHARHQRAPCTRGCAWVCSTPSGAPLDPDVNSTAASCSRSVHALGRPGAPIGQRVEVVDHDLRAAPRVDACARRRLAPSWWWSGAAIAPRRQHARYSSATSSRFGDCHATASPGSTPARAQAARDARDARSASVGAAATPSAARRATGGPTRHPARRYSAASGVRKVGSSTRRRQARRFQPSLAGVAPRSTLVPMKLRWISTVPAPMHSPRMSRYTRSTGYSRREAVAAEQLDRLVAHELRGEVRRGLRHRGLERGRRAVRAGHVHARVAAAGARLRAASPCRRPSTAGPGSRRACLSPTLALAHVLHRVLERALRGADAHRRVAAPFVVDVRDQRLERLAVRRVAPQQHVVGLDAHVVERELGLARARAGPSSRACRRP